MKIRSFLLIPAFLILSLVGRTQNDLNGPLGSAFRVSNRATIQKKLSPKACAVVFSGGFDRFSRGGTVPRPFHPAPDFFYLTGLSVPDAVLVIFDRPQALPEGEVAQLLFVPDENDLVLAAMGEVYTGKMGLQPGGWAIRPTSQWRKFCIDVLGSDQVKSVLTQPVELPSYRKPGELAYADLGSQLFAGLAPGFPFDPEAQTIYEEIRKVDSTGIRPLIVRLNAYLNYFPGVRPDPILDAFVQVSNARDLEVVQKRIRNIKVDLGSLNGYLQEMRAVKQPEELVQLRTCASKLTKAMEKGLRMVKPGLEEALLAEELASALRRSGCELAMPVRVAAGPHAALPYYNRNQGKLPEAGFVTLDFAGRLAGYHARVTRTVPANGKFSKGQRELYDLVLQAHKDALGVCTAGKAPSKVVAAAQKGFEAGTKRMGLALNNKGRVRMLRVVDISPVGLDLNALPPPDQLKVGMVFVLETALYLPDHSGIAEKWRSTGLVLRDVIEITSGQPKVLTQGIPLSVNGLEALLRGE